MCARVYKCVYVRAYVRTGMRTCGRANFCVCRRVNVKHVLHFQVKKWCFVTYQYFNLSRYPKFASTLSTYAWKPFVIEASIFLYVYFHIVLEFAHN